MSADKDRLQTAQWVLERVNGWIAAAEVKLGVVVAIDTGMLGALGAAISGASVQSKTAWAWVFSIVAAVALVSGMFCAAMSLLPRVKGPTGSLIFFGNIAPLSPADYVDKLRRATDAQLLDDCADQIQRNSKIAIDKFGWIRTSMLWSFASVLPWFGALMALHA